MEKKSIVSAEMGETLGVFQHEAFEIMSLRMVHYCELPENGVRVDGQW